MTPTHTQGEEYSCYTCGSKEHTQGNHQFFMDVKTHGLSKSGLVGTPPQPSDGWGWEKEARKLIHNGAVLKEDTIIDFIRSLLTETERRVRHQAVQEERKIKWPKHDGGLHLSHNPHKANYESVEHYVNDANSRSESPIDDGWVSLAEKKNAIETDSLWELQWYPNTPVGFNIIYASSLEAILSHFLKEREE